MEVNDLFRLKDVGDRIPFTFVDREFDGLCYQVDKVIYQWSNGATLGVCAGIRNENPLVVIARNPLIITKVNSK